MEAVFETLNEPLVLWSLFAGAIVLVLIDWFFPVDWPAFLGYALFAVFVGATVPAIPVLSLAIIVIVFVLMLVLHEFLFSRFLTNAPKFECPTEPNAAVTQSGAVDIAKQNKMGN